VKNFVPTGLQKYQTALHCHKTNLLQCNHAGENIEINHLFASTLLTYIGIEHIRNHSVGNFPPQYGKQFVVAKGKI